jgi:hypothetical protein
VPASMCAECVKLHLSFNSVLPVRVLTHTVRQDAATRVLKQGRLLPATNTTAAATPGSSSSSTSSRHEVTITVVSIRAPAAAAPRTLLLLVCWRRRWCVLQHQAAPHEPQALQLVGLQGLLLRRQAWRPPGQRQERVLQDTSSAATHK